MTNLFGLVDLTSFRFKYLLADIAGCKWRMKVRPRVAVTDVIVMDWQRSDRGEDHNNYHLFFHDEQQYYCTWKRDCKKNSHRVWRRATWNKGGGGVIRARGGNVNRLTSEATVKLGLSSWARKIYNEDIDVIIDGGPSYKSEIPFTSKKRGHSNFKVLWRL